MLVGAIGEDLYLELSLLHEFLVCYCDKTSQPKQLRKEKGLLWFRVIMGQSPPWQGSMAAGVLGQPGRRTHRNHMSFMLRKQKEKLENKAKT